MIGPAGNFSDIDNRLRLLFDPAAFKGFSPEQCELFRRTLGAE
jgi:hypothetical protein